ncbi:MAG TPA: hypothetical protein VJM11_07655 [Nevskiaceae bacterium]|nr:hypothetical protein [Nevskiaceae bacterium]
MPSTLVRGASGPAPLARWLLLLCLVPGLLVADVAVPPLKARVTDLTQTLDAA